MVKMKKICVFCGSSIGNNEIYRLKTIELGKLLVKNNIDLVYGGGNIGLMGELANSVLKEKGKVIGVTTKLIYERVPQIKLTEMYIVNNMHERKSKMYEISDAFIALPGGIGTIEELFEIFTWSQIGIHNKPIGLLNISNYYKHLIQFLDNALYEGFIKKSHKESLIIKNNPDDLIKELYEYNVPTETKWNY